MMSEEGEVKTLWLMWTMTFTLNNKGGHWRVLSREMTWSDLPITCVENRLKGEVNVEL